jgi:hypothetical protein
MTVEELKALIAEVVDERLRLWLLHKQPVDKRRLQEIFDSIDRHMITPPPGAPTGSEMIIEERNRWRKGM